MTFLHQLMSICYECRSRSIKLQMNLYRVKIKKLHFFFTMSEKLATFTWPLARPHSLGLISSCHTFDIHTLKVQWKKVSLFMMFKSQGPFENCRFFMKPTICSETQFKETLKEQCVKIHKNCFYKLYILVNI